MLEKLIDRKGREAKATAPGKPGIGPQKSKDTLVSDEELFNQLGAKVKVVKKQ